MGGAMKYFLKKLLDHEIFGSIWVNVCSLRGNFVLGVVVVKRSVKICKQTIARFKNKHVEGNRAEDLR